MGMYVEHTVIVLRLHVHGKTQGIGTHGLAGLLEGLLGGHALGDVAAEEGLNNAVDGTEEDTTLTCRVQHAQKNYYEGLHEFTYRS